MERVQQVQGCTGMGWHVGVPAPVHHHLPCLTCLSVCRPTSSAFSFLMTDTCMQSRRTQPQSALGGEALIGCPWG